MPVVFAGSPDRFAGPWTFWSTVGEWPGSAGRVCAIIGVVAFSLLGLGSALGAGQLWKSADRHPVDEPAEEVSSKA